MNDRIKELIKQAGTDTSGKWMDMDHVHTLVKLVVHDCNVKILEWKTEPFPVDPDFLVKIIEEHFGIKK